MGCIVRDYVVGDLIRLTASFTDAEGEPVDPTTVEVRTLSPSGTAELWLYGTDPEVVQDAPGEYHFDLDANESGSWGKPTKASKGWAYRWESTGIGQAAGEGRFDVTVSDFAGVSP